MTVPEFFDRIKQGVTQLASDMHNRIADAQATELARNRQEAERRQAIASGRITPVNAMANLEIHEVAYAVFGASRFATITRETSTTHKKGTVGRAIVGGVLFGPAGAIVGAMTAKNKTTVNVSHNNEQIDAGRIIFTNRRFLFIGKQVVSIPYEWATEVQFYAPRLHIKHQQMLPAEYFHLSGPDAEIAGTYYNGIQIARRSNQP